MFCFQQRFAKYVVERTYPQECIQLSKDKEFRPLDRNSSTLGYSFSPQRGVMHVTAECGRPGMGWSGITCDEAGFLIKVNELG